LILVSSFIASRLRKFKLNSISLVASNLVVIMLLLNLMKHLISSLLLPFSLCYNPMRLMLFTIMCVLSIAGQKQMFGIPQNRFNPIMPSIEPSKAVTPALLSPTGFTRRDLWFALCLSVGLSHFSGSCDNLTSS
jgi:hypothetical protein